MNIIKFRDLIRVNDEPFNRLLKGQYAYFIRMRYAVPFGEITKGEYIRYEGDDEELKKSGHQYWDIYEGDLRAFVDDEYTDRANSIAPFQRENKYVTGPELTIDDLRKFRSRLANGLLAFTGAFDESFERVLKYYKGGMYDETLKILSDLSQPITLPNQPQGCGCGCTGAQQFIISQIPGVVSQAIAPLCDPAEVYRNYMYRKMVEKFSDVDFWLDRPVGFLAEFKSYVDNIIKAELPLKTSSYIVPTRYDDCTCLLNTDQMALRAILESLSGALQWMIDGDLLGHRMQIADILTKWSSQLYESMQWDGFENGRKTSNY